MKGLTKELRSIGIDNMVSLFLVIIILVLVQIMLELLLNVEYDLKTSIANIPKVGLGAALYHYLFVRRKR